MALRRRTTVIVLLIVLLLIGTARVVGFLAPLEGPFERALNPIQTALYRAGLAVREAFGRIEDRRELRARVTTLEAEVQTLRADNARLVGQLEDATALEAQLQAADRLSLETRAARVIGAVGGERGRLLLDRGSVDGIVSGLAVIAGDGLLLGTISDVQPSRSTLLLITDNASTVGARLAGPAVREGIVRGEHGLTLTLTLVSRNEPLAEGELIVTAAIDPNVPADLLIGMIETVETKPGDLYHTARVRPAAQLQNLRVASIVFPHR